MMCRYGHQCLFLLGVNWALEQAYLTTLCTDLSFFATESAQDSADSWGDDCWFQSRRNCPPRNQRSASYFAPTTRLSSAGVSICGHYQYGFWIDGLAIANPDSFRHLMHVMVSCLQFSYGCGNISRIYSIEPDPHVHAILQLPFWILNLMREAIVCSFAVKGYAA